MFDSNANKVICSLINEKQDASVSGVEFTKEGVLLTRSNGVAEYWKTDLLSHTCELKSQIPGTAGINASIHPLNPYFLYGPTNTSWGMYNLETGSKLCQIELENEDELTCVTVHPDGLMMATGSTKGEIKIWDIRNQSVVATFDGHAGPIKSIKFSEKAIHLVSSSANENILHLWSLKKLNNPPQQLVHKQGSKISSVDFDPFGSYVVSA